MRVARVRCVASPLEHRQCVAEYRRPNCISQSPDYRFYMRTDCLLAAFSVAVQEVHHVGHELEGSGGCSIPGHDGEYIVRRGRLSAQFPESIPTHWAGTSNWMGPAWRRRPWGQTFAAENSESATAGSSPTTKPKIKNGTNRGGCADTHGEPSGCCPPPGRFRP